ncbi:nucleotidyl transferase AbiEii/AbiGii toxin family protein [Jatrophihabitans lederbergiae]|uniref:nucleotidyl transferase AbiEii/AbiGii toxin family protein n=1 Tax=Jatrophihabitans lederbergiae TaxID=3075547 RepID=UPI0037C1964C
MLKGGVLLAAFSLRRPTKDIDLQATGIANDADDVLERIREIAAIDVDDGLIFDPRAITAHTIREDDDYAGVRIRLIGTLGKSRLPVGIDVNFGDPIWPAPSEITLPRLVQIGQEPVHILGYPLPMVIAEKTVTALERGEANTRWRDFADVFTISSAHEISASELVGALQAVAAYRGAVLRPLLPALSTMPETAQAKWANWRRRQDYPRKLPEQFADILSIVAAFTDPILGSAVPEGARWNPTRQTWESNP